MEGAAPLALSLLMIAGFALAVGGVYRLVKLHDRKRGILMLVAAVVMFANVAILTVPIG